MGNYFTPKKEKVLDLGVVVHTCNLSTQEAEAGELPKVQGQTGLHSATLSQTKPIKQTNKKELNQELALLQCH